MIYPIHSIPPVELKPKCVVSELCSKCQTVLSCCQSLRPHRLQFTTLSFLQVFQFTDYNFFHSIFLLVLNSLSTCLLQEVYEQQKEIILLGERVVLATLGFDFNLLHPYKPLVDAIKKFKVAQNALAQVAWNFVNDGYGKLLSLVYIPFFSVSS